MATFISIRSFANLMADLDQNQERLRFDHIACNSIFRAYPVDTQDPYI
jgi:hypothetical protein